MKIVHFRLNMNWRPEEARTVFGLKFEIMTEVSAWSEPERRLLFSTYKDRLRYSRERDRQSLMRVWCSL